MKMKKIIALLTILMIPFLSIEAQLDLRDTIPAYSLTEIKNYAVEHSYEVKNAELNIKKAKAQKWETTAIGLPQISGSAEYQNFPDIPTQLMPNFIEPAVYDVNTNAFGLTPLAPLNLGDKIPVQFGSKHNVDWNLSATQLIFSGEYIVGLKASRIYLSLSEQSKEKSILTVKENIEKTYYLILVTEESINVLDSVYTNIKKLYDETQAYYKSGFSEETDVEQLKLNLQNTENSLISFQKQRDVLYKLLKFQAGLNFDKKISISGTLKDAVNCFNYVFKLYYFL